MNKHESKLGEKQLKTRTKGRIKHGQKYLYEMRMGGIREKISQSMKPTWIDLDRHGYMKSLRRNGMFFIVSELLQNSWDTDATKVALTLSEPSNGKSKLTCADNSPDGYTDLSHAYTLFAESEKKHDTTKRGRFNAGEKQVLCMMEEAEISSTTGTITYLKNGSRKQSNPKWARPSLAL